MAKAAESRALHVVVWVLVVTLAASPFVVRWAYDDWNGWVVFFSIALSLPWLVSVTWTLVQQRQHRGEQTSFAPNRLAMSTVMITASVLALCVFGIVGAMLNFLLVPAAVCVLAVAWVQPRGSDVVPTVLLGLGLTILVAWFAGRADEVPQEGFVAAVLILVVVALLAWFRRRGDLTIRTTRP